MKKFLAKMLQLVKDDLEAAITLDMLSIAIGFTMVEVSCLCIPDLKIVSAIMEYGGLSLVVLGILFPYVMAYLRLTEEDNHDVKSRPNGKKDDFWKEERESRKRLENEIAYYMKWREGLRNSDNGEQPSTAAGTDRIG